MAHNAMTTEEVRRGVIPGSVSDAILYGKTVREAVERGKIPSKRSFRSRTATSFSKASSLRRITRGIAASAGGTSSSRA